MVEVQGRNKPVTRLIVQGNQSMSWRANLYLAGALGVICMGTALVMASYGLWMVIPFAGLEILFVVYCLYLTLRRLSRKEVITVDDDGIKLEWGYNSPDITVNLPRRWSRLSYHCPDSPFEVGELSLSAHGKRYALGKCLNRDEKRTLYRELKAALHYS